MYVYIEFEKGLYTVGFYKPDGKFEPESDHTDSEEAAKRVHYLNGGRDEESECDRRTCTYYSHYLVYYDPARNGPQLQHEAFHFAEKKCDEAQARVIKWYDDHKDDGEYTPIPEVLEQLAGLWENRVCA